jgi:hypothetical protein
MWAANVYYLLNSAYGQSKDFVPTGHFMLKGSAKVFYLLNSIYGQSKKIVPTGHFVLKGLKGDYCTK